MTARWRVTVAFSFDRVIFRDVVVEGASVTEAKRATRTLFTWGTSHRIESVTPVENDTTLGKGQPYDRLGTGQ